MIMSMIMTMADVPDATVGENGDDFSGANPLAGVKDDALKL